MIFNMQYGSGGGVTPSGSINITANGTYNVTQYASAVVNVSPTPPPVSSGPLKFTTEESACILTITSPWVENSQIWEGQWSFDGTDWGNIIFEDNEWSQGFGGSYDSDNLYIRGHYVVNPFYDDITEELVKMSFELSYYCDVSGNIMSLFSETGYDSLTTIPANGLKGQFEYSLIVDASGLSLPATTIGGGAYDRMFADCSYLTRMPSLQASVTGSDLYNEMFMNCSSLSVYEASGTGHTRQISIGGTGETYKMFNGTIGDYSGSEYLDLPLTVYTNNS